MLTPANGAGQTRNGHEKRRRGSAGGSRRPVKAGLIRVGDIAVAKKSIAFGYEPVCSFYVKSANRRDERLLQLVGVYLFKGQLVVPVRIVVVNIFSPIVDRQEGDKINAGVPILVFKKMREQYGDLNQLVKRHPVDNYQEQQYVDCLFHAANIEIKQFLGGV